eukprot:11162282-Prorocentrum_lima.AAC.1
MPGESGFRRGAPHARSRGRRRSAPSRAPNSDTVRIDDSGDTINVASTSEGGRCEAKLHPR